MRLRAGATAVDASTHAVALLEECPLFNAGVGAVLTRDGCAELDAAVMDGATRACGAVAGVSRVKSPVRLARAVMERTGLTFFGGPGADALAAELGLDLVDPGYFITEHRLQELRARQKRLPPADGATRSEDAPPGTVGAVARDGFGRLAAATSTGGMTNKPPGRIGDSPIIGAGTFADNETLAVSCTGTGEAFIRAGFGWAVHARLAYCGWDLQRACASVETAAVSPSTTRERLPCRSTPGRCIGRGSTVTRSPRSPSDAILPDGPELPESRPANRSTDYLKDRFQSLPSRRKKSLSSRQTIIRVVPPPSM